MADGTTTDVRLCHLAHLNGAHHAAFDFGPFEAVLQRERVHAGGQHADVIGLAAVHALGRTRHAAEDVSAAHGDGNLDAIIHDLLDLPRQVFDHLGIDAVSCIPISASPESLRSTRLYL